MLLLILSALSALFKTVNPASAVEENYKFDRFTAIDVENSFDVEYVKGDTYDVSVEIDEEFLPYLDVDVTSKGMLRVSLRKMPAKLTLTKAKKMNVTVVAPTLNSINISGSCKFTTEETIKCRGEFILQASGASKVEQIDVECNELHIYCSGASKIAMSGSAMELSAEVSGSSNCSLNMDVADFEAKLTGASSITLNGKCDEVEAEINGSSKLVGIGKARELSVEANGASVVNTLDMAVNEAEISLSGTSRAKVDVERKLEVEMSGVSVCEYRGGSKLDLKVKSNRASSIKKL